MNFNIYSQNEELSKETKEYMLKKLEKLEKFFAKKEDMNVKVVVRSSGIYQVVEVTIPIRGTVIRAEERKPDLYEALESVIGKLEKQIKKNKEKIKKHMKKESVRVFSLEDIKEEPVEKGIQEIIKNKKVSVKPMSIEEAMLQMDLLDHDFFVFKDAEKMKCNVLYRRKDGEYGIIELS